MVAQKVTAPVSMNTLKSRILNPALTSTYSVTIVKPPALTTSAYDPELLELTCMEASLPGSSLATIETNGDYMGVVEKMAYRRLYDETIDFTFLVTQDSNYQQIRFFDLWMRFIAGENLDNKVLSSSTFNSRVKYPDTYKSGLKIIKFERGLGSGISPSNNVLTYEFVDAFPKAMNSIPVSYEASQLLKTTVSFTYSRYFITSEQSMADQNYGTVKRNPASPGNADVPSGVSVTQLYGPRKTDVPQTLTVNNTSDNIDGPRSTLGTYYQNI